MYILFVLYFFIGGDKIDCFFFTYFQYNIIKMEKAQRLAEYNRAYTQNPDNKAKLLVIRLRTEAKNRVVKNERQLLKYHNLNAEEKEKNKLYLAKYYNDNKEQYAKKFVCECGKESLSCNKNNHFNTKLHLRKMVLYYCSVLPMN